MVLEWRTALLLTLVPLLAAADLTWNDKPIPDWTESDAKQLLADSPWSKTVTPTVDTSAAKNGTRPTVGMRGMGIGGIGRHAAADRSSSQASPETPPSLRLRWESALPIREAELKARETSAPTTDEDHYAIAVYGVPASKVGEDTKAFEEQLRRDASLKRDDRKALKPSSVEVLLGENGTVILYLFPRTDEITWRDHNIAFEAQVDHWKISQTFSADAMMFQGKLEL